MYAAKQAGKGRSAVFAPDMDSAIIGQLAARGRAAPGGRARRVRRCTTSRSSSSRPGAVAGVEALVRWQHPERGLVSPLDFIPLAEETGLIVPIGRWVLREACRQMRAWQRDDATHPPLTVSVNLSARQLDEPGLVELGARRAGGRRAGPAHLVLEITESLLLVDLPTTVGTLLELRALGVRLAIDDFGTGYSSLAYLETCRSTSSRSTSPSSTASPTRRPEFPEGGRRRRRSAGAVASAS